MVEARLRSPVGRAVVPVLVGLGVIAAVFGLLWLIAVVVTHNANESNRRVGADVFEVGRVDRLADSVTRNGPILFPNLVGPAGQRPVGLAHDGASDFEGWRVFSLRPSGNAPDCLVQVDRQTKRSFKTPEAAGAAGLDIKGRFPTLQVTIYDNVTKSRTVVEV